MNNALTDVLPAKVRKYVYAAYALAVAAVGICAVLNVDLGNVPQILTAVGGALGAVAASNVKHQAAKP